MIPSALGCFVKSATVSSLYWCGAGEQDEAATLEGMTFRQKVGLDHDFMGGAGSKQHRWMLMTMVMMIRMMMVLLLMRTTMMMMMGA
jgi:hypothetical protein